MVYREPATEGNGAYVPCLLAQSFLFKGHKKHFEVTDEVHQKVRSLH